MGQQSGTMTVVPDGSGGFSGGLSGSLGSMDIQNGTIDGDTLRWQMKMTSPMPMKLDCEATVGAGGEASGTVDAGLFGKMPFRATKHAAN
ncbi:hypothetical protein GRI62_02185 [Erythrobacter arachoides]|uniref:Uncharacterized protein n=1 Tax=Aurantiacibacter arachoides TaxID=1850444 RepID=A0A844ZWE2_9SPHN|nr:hypothetical protein [Aurantiacibacter arachoides]MXO92413.1 hypothetical protein [Aurantiacibacter arachoides]